MNESVYDSIRENIGTVIKEENIGVVSSEPIIKKNSVSDIGVLNDNNILVSNNTSLRKKLRDNKENRKGLHQDKNGAQQKINSTMEIIKSNNCDIVIYRSNILKLKLKLIKGKFDFRIATFKEANLKYYHNTSGKKFNVNRFIMGKENKVKVDKKRDLDENLYEELLDMIQEYYVDCGKANVSILDSIKENKKYLSDLKKSKKANEKTLSDYVEEKNNISRNISRLYLQYLKDYSEYLKNEYKLDKAYNYAKKR